MIFFDILWPIVAKKIYPSMLKLNATDFCHILLGIQNINPKLYIKSDIQSTPFIAANHET